MRHHNGGVSQKRLRAAGIILGAMFILWLPIEDVDTRYVIPLAVGISAWLGTKFLLGRERLAGVGIYGAAGVLTGLAVTPLAVVLIAFKGGLHAHGFPDFALVQVRDLLRETPWWAAAGLAVGLTVGARIKRIK